MLLAHFAIKFATISRVKLFVFAAISRLLLIAIVLFTSHFISDWDTSNLLTHNSGSEEIEEGALDHSFSPLDQYFLPLNTWDAVHFRHIAQHGYTHEHLVAFFPLLPFVLRQLTAISIHFPVGGEMMWFAAFQILCFSTACVLLRELTWLLTARRKSSSSILCQAYQQRQKCNIGETAALTGWSTLLFLMSPATVFTIATYTESLFAMLCFGGLLLLETNHEFLAALVFSVATCSRSNGILLSGYLVYRVLQDVCASIVMRQQQNNNNNSNNSLLRVFLRTFKRLICVGIIVMPYFAVNYHAYQRFCGSGSESNAVVGAIPLGAAQQQQQVQQAEEEEGEGSLSPLLSVYATSPNCPVKWMAFYTNIQRVYWGVGWFAYYTVNNIPNFVIAAPLYVMVCASIHHMIRQRDSSSSSRSNCGIRRKGNRLLLFKFLDVVLSPGWDDVINNRSRSEHEAEETERSRRPLPHVGFLLGMMTIAMLQMHIQVVNRFVLGCPALYWLTASLCCGGDSDGVDEHNHDLELAKKEKGPPTGATARRGSSTTTTATTTMTVAVIMYCCTWAGLGLVLFPNFLPWT